MSHRKLREVAPRYLAAAVVTLALAAITGCGSSGNGIADGTATEALSAAFAAVEKAQSVHVASSTLQGPVKASLDADLTGQGARGTISLLTYRMEVIRRGNTLYVKSTPEVYKRLGITQKIPQGAWAALPAGRAAQLASETDLTAEVRRIINTGGTITKGRTTTIGGQPVLELKTEGKLFKGVLYLRTTGEPYPVKLEKQGRETGKATFTDWNTTSAPAAPTATVAAFE